MDNLNDQNLSVITMIEMVSKIPTLVSELQAVSEKVDKLTDQLSNRQKEESKKKLSQRQTAKYLKISVPFLAKCRNQGLIASINAGSRILYTVSEATRFKDEVLPRMPRIRYHEKVEVL